MVGTVGFGVDHPFLLVLSGLIAVVGGGDEQTQSVLRFEFPSDIGEKLSVGASLAHNIFSSEVDCEGKVRVSTLGLEGPQEGWRHLLELIMGFGEKMFFFFFGSDQRWF